MRRLWWWLMGGTALWLGLVVLLTVLLFGSDRQSVAGTAVERPNVLPAWQSSVPRLQVDCHQTATATDAFRPTPCLVAKHKAA